MIYFQSFLALLAVLSLVWLLYRLFLRLQNRLGLGGSARQISVIERTALGDKRSLLLVDLSGRRLLLGSTPQSLNLLVELPQEEGVGGEVVVEKDDAEKTGESVSFHRLLVEEGAA